ncbi:hypothetical protein CC117_30200 [Parafrankia colletiae]|uniref:DUF397 domain-containing protein n=1 Tax=Parafrankia colletiae TaxID=573497 RepID=A0A1S1Q154_9ACTN|nr:DUF397 domain-containing protein [Parafrankia colletiae]MCK9904169.1 DUF397 domain-containing protein [Frankia sp. Cpl3]OHV28628.1 hypothetical protein CC117_30200 [Parafrankia colletiae]
MTNSNGRQDGFLRSTRCEGAGNCVEVAFVTYVAVRDSKNPEGPVLWFTLDEWEGFTTGVKWGEFDV